MLQSLCDITRSIAILRKIGYLDIALDITAEVCTACFFEGDIRTFINHTAFLKLDLGAIVYARYATESEHQGEVLGPSGLILVEACAFRSTIWRIVVRIYIGYIPSSIVIAVIITLYAPSLGSRTEVPVHREVDNAKT